MRDPKRIDRILALIEKLWKKYPDQRLGQLLFNYTRFGTRLVIPKTKHLITGAIKDIFFHEDDDVEKDLMIVLRFLDKKKVNKK